MGTVYVLKLKGGYFYIGFTKNYRYRMQQHFSGCGAKFTQLHPPLEVVEIFDNVTKAKEHSVTKAYIRKYGANRVRGGDWVGTTKNSFCPPHYLPKKTTRRGVSRSE